MNLKLLAICSALLAMLSAAPNEAQAPKPDSKALAATGILDRLRGLTMKTQAGELCRRAALRVISRYQWSTRDLGSHLARPAPAWAAVVRFDAEVGSSQRSFVGDVKPCLAAAPTDARATLARVMVGA